MHWQQRVKHPYNVLTFPCLSRVYIDTTLSVTEAVSYQPNTVAAHAVDGHELHNRSQTPSGTEQRPSEPSLTCTTLTARSPALPFDTGAQNTQMRAKQRGRWSAFVLTF